MSDREHNKMEELKNEIKQEEVKNENEDNQERFVSLTPETPVRIDELRGILNDNFPKLSFPTEIGLSVMAQLLIKDIKNPFALVYVDVPSSGKTIVLNFFSRIKELTFTTDNFTPASFVSHSANTKKTDLSKIDMLPQIRYKTLIIRDLAPIFAKNDDDVQSALGILIRVLDGEGLETNSGLHGKRGYSGDYLFMILAASTQIRPKIWKAMGNLGSRLFFLNMEGKEKSEEELADQLRISCRDKEEICRMATDEFLKTLWNKYPDGIDWNKGADDTSLLVIITRFAKILARLRSAINVWEEGYGERKYNFTQPITEMPDRLNQLLYNLARGHALVCGRENISMEDLKAVAKVSIDSAPPNRSKMFKLLLKNDGKITTKEVMSQLKCSRPTALKEMQQLVILGIVEPSEDLSEAEKLHFLGRPETEISLKEEFGWFLSEECQLLLHGGKNSLLTKPTPVLTTDANIEAEPENRQEELF